MYLCRRVSRRRSSKVPQAGVTYIECLGGAHFLLALFGATFVGFMDMLSITIEAVVEFHVTLR
jgi:hypothetical protein